MTELSSGIRTSSFYDVRAQPVCERGFRPLDVTSGWMPAATSNLMRLFPRGALPPGNSRVCSELSALGSGQQPVGWP